MLRARDIADLCDDLALERASVTVKEGWDHSAQFFLTFGPPAYRQTMLVEPALTLGELKAKLEAARALPTVGIVMPLAAPNLAPERVSPVPKAKPPRRKNAAAG